MVSPPPLIDKERIAILDGLMCLSSELRRALMQSLEREMRAELGDEEYSVLAAKIEAEEVELTRDSQEKFLCCLREEISDEKGEPATERDIDLALEGVRILLGHIADGARGQHPVSGAIERAFIIGRALQDEEFTALSFTDTAEMLGISKQAHHYQLKKMEKFIGCRLLGQRGVDASEAARKNALRQHGNEVEAEEDELWRPDRRDSDKRREAEKEISKLIQNQKERQSAGRAPSRSS